MIRLGIPHTEKFHGFDWRRINVVGIMHLVVVHSRDNLFDEGKYSDFRHRCLKLNTIFCYTVRYIA